MIDIDRDRDGKRSRRAIGCLSGAGTDDRERIREMKKKTVKIAVAILHVLKLVVGVLCVVVGLAALLTPLTPGSWLIPIGLELLGLRILLANKLQPWIDARPHSKVARILHRGLNFRWRDLWRKKRGEKMSVANSVGPPPAGDPPGDPPAADTRHTGELAGRPDRPQRPG
jgi:hypothetical protein